MDSNAKPVGIVELSLVPSAPATAAGDFSQGSAARQQADHAEKAASYRLIIEEGPVRGTFIYKTLDSATGEVVRQFPREQVLRMAESADYAAGGVFKTRT